MQQIKKYITNRSKFAQLKYIYIYKISGQIWNDCLCLKKQNYKNYFENAYNKDYIKKDSTLKRTPKNYKD